MINFPLPRIDLDDRLRELLLPYLRFKNGDVWEDKTSGHKIACLDCADAASIQKLKGKEKAVLAIHDPPYNFVAFRETDIEVFVDWCKLWIKNTYDFLSENSSLYIWLGADQNNHFQPLADFMIMMRDSGFKSRSFITMRNQRGYGTQKNWMSVRQELLYYTKGKPAYNPEAEYTDIPKIMNGYYKKVNGKETKNFERSKSEFIRAGNVWVDVQQIFYRMNENINGCYAQKPLKAIQRILRSGSNPKDLVTDFFSHSGTTLIASEIENRICYTTEIDPVFCEITLRRLENYRQNGLTGWQNSNPFASEILSDLKLKAYLNKNYNYDFSRLNLLNGKMNKESN
jgi:site-specific DNA-methyltransferase (adenine-specific)